MHPCMGHLIFPACRRHIYYSISLMAHDEGKKLLLCGTRLLEEQQNTIVYLPHEQKTNVQGQRQLHFLCISIISYRVIVLRTSTL